MSYRRWDIVVINYPFIEGIGSKHRPALVVSTDVLHRGHDLYWVVMITTAKSGAQPNDIPITDHEKAGLPEDCVIRVPRLMATTESLIRGRAGTVTQKDRNAVAALLKKFMP